MPFFKYSKIDGEVKACRLSISTEQEIADALSKASTMGDLLSLQAVRSEITNCLEFKFRYRNHTTYTMLNTGDWLIELASGRYVIMDHSTFVTTHFNTDLDSGIPSLRRESFEDAFLRYVNKTFPELYAHNLTPSITPYEALDLQSVECTGEVKVEAMGSATIVSPKEVGKTGAEVAGSTVTIEFVAPAKVSTYMVAMHSGSYNAPTAWTVKGIKEDNSEIVIHTVTTDDVKTGAYRTTESAMVKKVIFTFTSFEDESAVFNPIRLVCYKGGDEVAPPTATPLLKFTDETLEKVAELVSDWYDLSRNEFTLKFTDAGITDFGGFAKILTALLKATYINEHTKVKLHLGNTITYPEITSITLMLGYDIATSYVGKLPNQYDPIALHQFVAEIEKLSKADAARITQVNVAPATPEAVPAVMQGVTHDTMSYWNEFVENLIKKTSISNPGAVQYQAS